MIGSTRKITIQQIDDEGLGYNELKPDFATIRATIKYIRRDFLGTPPWLEKFFFFLKKNCFRMAKQKKKKGIWRVPIPSRHHVETVRVIAK